MALDHVRDLMHTNSITQSPTDLNTTTPILFFTRLITHLCAPIFVFLAGTSAYISLKRNTDIVTAKSHLLKRGLWLILLEFTIVNLGMFFDLGLYYLTSSCKAQSVHLNIAAASRYSLLFPKHLQSNYVDISNHFFLMI
jgi:uncharacterized membrane protein